MLPPAPRTPIPTLALAVSLGPLLLCLLAAPAHADAVKLEFVTKVPEGTQPRIRITALQPIDDLNIELTRDGASSTRFPVGPLAAGSRHDVAFDAPVGNHHFSGQVTVVIAGQAQQHPLSLNTVVAPSSLQVQIDRSRLDLVARHLEARLSRPATRAQITILGATGGAILSRSEQPCGESETCLITWPAIAGEIGRIDLRLYDKDGFYAGVSLFPWSVSIPHEEVVFANDSATIAPGEQPKLTASLALVSRALSTHQDLGPITLYVAGHTDTVGAAAYNLNLSRRRAQAIATWFRQQGLRLPIACEGFGEFAPRLATPDNIPEPHNRRVDYILSVEEPVFKTTGSFVAQWKRLK